MAKLVVYSMNGCSACVQVSNILKAKDVEHEVVKVDEDQDAYNFFKARGHRGVPHLYLVGEEVATYVGDYNRLKTFTDEDFADLK